ncbi:MAG: glycosyltransferase family 4 protein [Candidatus Eiseniibacteriota bacterium]|nr:MAG: glycosyltransferase family 4 protein [Candidatus Eisenbacteria bacterium]
MAKEIDYLGCLFDEVRHLATTGVGEFQRHCSLYRNDRVTVDLVPAQGGARLVDKGRILLSVPQWLSKIIRLHQWADVLQLRCPANISLIACEYLARRSEKIRWAKWASSCTPLPGEGFASRRQRRRLFGGSFGGPVTLNGSLTDQPSYCHSFFNPCFAERELEEILKREKEYNTEERNILFVGLLEDRKRCSLVIEATHELLKRSFRCRLTIVGDGPCRRKLQELVKQRGCEGSVFFTGFLTREAVKEEFSRADFLVLPSTIEGYAKVLTEAMAFRVPCLVTPAGCQAQIFNEKQCGIVVDMDDPVGGIAEGILTLAGNEEFRRRVVQKGIPLAKASTYERYVLGIRSMLQQHYHAVLPMPDFSRSGHCSTDD